ncbi:20229_t:CDS:1, partial [Funneliformis geosporum]
MKPYLTGVSDGNLRTMTCRARKINKLFGYEYDPVTLKKIDGMPGYMVNRVTCNAYSISKLTNPQIQYIIDQVKLKTITSHVNETSETMANTSANDPSDDNFSNTSDVTDYFKEEEEIPEGPKNVLSESEEEEDSDANKSDSDVYFKSDDSDSDDEYDHELHERLQREEMTRIAKLEEKPPADDDFDKILMEIHENHDIYFDDSVPLTH